MRWSRPVRAPLLLIEVASHLQVTAHHVSVFGHSTLASFLAMRTTMVRLLITFLHRDFAHCSSNVTYQRTVCKHESGWTSRRRMWLLPT